MEEAPSSTYQDELEWCIRQLELGLLQRNASSKQARKHMKAHIKKGDFKNSGSVIYKKCASENSESRRDVFISSNSSFQFNFFPSGCVDTLSELPGASANSVAGIDCTTLPEASVSHQHCEKADLWKNLGVKGHEDGNLVASLSGEQRSEFTFSFTIPKEYIDSDQGVEFSEKGPLFKRSATQDMSSGRIDVAAAHVSNVTEANCSGKVLPLVLDSVNTETGHCKEGSDIMEESWRSSPQKKKKKKTKKKQTAEYSDTSNKPKPETPNDSTGFSLTSEEQLKREVSWCVEQLELGLRRQQSNQKQVNEALHALKTLHSEKAPLVKKRQLMRSMFGDYRKKMEEERQQQLKLMQTASKSARVVAVMGTTKSKVFRRCADFSGRNGEPVTSSSCTAVVNRVQCTAEETFVFAPVQEEFKFNFF